MTRIAAPVISHSVSIPSPAQRVLRAAPATASPTAEPTTPASPPTSAPVTPDAKQAQPTPSPIPLHPNPVLALRAFMQGQVSYDKGQELAQYVGWIAEMLADTQIGYRYETDMHKSYSQIRSDLDQSARKLRDEIGKITQQAVVQGKDFQLPEAPLDTVTESIESIQELAIDNVGDFISEVVSAAPLIGLAVSTIRLVGLELKSVWAIKKMMDAETLLERTEFILQREAMLGAVDYRIYKGRIDSLDLASALAKTGSQIIPIPFVGTALSLVTSAVQTVLKLFILLELEKKRATLNEKISKGSDKLSYDDLQAHPIARLMIPHYPEVDTLSLLGVLPPNWQVLQWSEGMRKLAIELGKSEEHRWLFSAYLGTEPFYNSVDHFPERWRPQIKQLKEIFEETNSHLFDMPFVLRKNSVIVYDAAPQGKFQYVQYIYRTGKERALAEAKRVGNGVAEAFINLIEELNKKTTPPPAFRETITYEPIQYMGVDPKTAPIFLVDVDEND